MIRRLRTALVFAAMTLLPIAALAHAHPKIMNPMPDSTVAAPANVTITFTEALEPKFSSIIVTDKSGTQVNQQPSHPGGDAATLTVALPPLAGGAYMVKWVSVATDGHRMTGEYAFNVK